MTQARDQVLNLNKDTSKLEFYENRLRQFDLQIIENQDYIAKLQADLLRSQEQNRTLTDKVRVVENLKEGEVGEKIQVYQDEILQLTTQFQADISELKKQLLAKERELEYQRNTMILKKDKFDEEITKQRDELNKNSSKDQRSLMEEISWLKEQRDKMQENH